MTEKNESELEIISSTLRGEGISINKDSVKRNASQGFINEVFTVDSSHGKLVIHISRIKKEQKRQKIWKKIVDISKVLHLHPHIPAAHIIASGTLGEDKYFTVQKFIEGKMAGGRVYEQDSFVDKWEEVSPDLMNTIEKHIAAVHQVPMNGYGWNGHAKEEGTVHKSWTEFLTKEIDLWVQSLSVIKSNTVLIDHIKKHFEKHKHVLVSEKSSLIHGDITNPGNIIVKDDTVVGFIDWEWSLAGDAAWEFAFNNKYPLDTYFNSFDHQYTETERDLFRQRAGLYEPLFLTWVMHVHAPDENNINYIAARARLNTLGFDI